MRGVGDMTLQRFFFVFLSFLLATEPLLYATDTGVSGVDFEYYHPATDSYGIFGVNSPRTMKAGKFYLNLSQSITRGKFLRVTTGGTTINMVDRIDTSDFLASLAINDFLTVGAEVPVHIYAKEANLTSLTDFTTQGIGDVVGFMKFRVLEDAHWWPGIALLYTNSFPTGDENRFFGTSHIVPGVQLAIGKETKYFTFIANAGALFPQGKTVLGAMFNDKVTYGAGIKVPFGFLDPHLFVMTEVHGFFETDKVQILTAPVEFTIGLRKEFCNGLALSAGGGGGWNDAVGNPTVRGIGAISFTSAGDRCGKAEKEEIKVVMKEAEEEKVEVNESLAQQIHTTVYFGFGSVRPTG
ncbi:MAG: hypothetical protein HY073_04015 [Deltaproteobacteria bacterium]|nr:hypothetical protein [Deltaproteobacteria bacterium]